jgi:hypothetical protein
MFALSSKIYWGYFGDALPVNEAAGIDGLTDTLSFLNSTTIFFSSYFTNKKFKKTVD